jgi:diphthine synthase
MLYIVGLGLGDERDITVRGLDAVRRCAKVYMEAYTSLLSLGLDPASLANLVRPLFSWMPTTCSRKCLQGLGTSLTSLSLQEKMYGKEITVADREMVEERADQMLTEAADTDIAFLVVGDPFG